MKRKVICFLMVSTVIFTNVLTTFGASIYVDNIVVPDANIRIKDEISFFPVRAISESLGYTVLFDDKTKTINVGDIFTHKVGTTYITMNDGEIIDIGVPSYIDDGTTYVSVRLFSQALGYDVEYDENTKNIWIYSNNSEEIKEDLDNGTDEVAVEDSYNQLYTDKLLSGNIELINESYKKRNEDISATKRNESAILLDDNSSATLNDVGISKVGDTTSFEGSTQYGLNSVILVKNNSLVNGNRVDISDSAIGSTGLYFDKSQANLNKFTINTNAKQSNGIVLNNGSDVSIDNSTLNTYGEKSEAFQVLNDSKLVVKNGTILSALSDLFLVDDSNVSLNDVNATTQSGNIFDIKGKSNITTNNTYLTSDTGSGVKIDNSDSTKINMTNGSLSSKNSTLFDITDSNVDINLNNVDLKNGKNLFDVESNNTNNNTFNLSANNQTMTGNFVFDDNINATINADNSSYINGQINGDNKASEVVLDLVGASQWDVAGDSYISVINPTLHSFNNINSNGYNVYYDKDDVRNSWLNGQQYKLNGGGKLVPMK